MTATLTPPATPRSPFPHAWKVLAVSAAAVYVVFLDATIVNIAFPAISADFHDVTRSGLSWVLNAYAVVFRALLVTAGRLADDRGRKRVFLAWWSSPRPARCAASPPTSRCWLPPGRRSSHRGALLVPACLALLLPEFPLAKRATAVGLWGAVGAVAAATGPSIGALLVEGPGWRWVFYVNLPFCAVALWFGRRILTESKGAGTRRQAPTCSAFCSSPRSSACFARDRARPAVGMVKYPHAGPPSPPRRSLLPCWWRVPPGTPTRPFR